MWPFKKRECSRCREIEDGVARLKSLDYKASDTDPMVLNAAFDGAAVKLWAAAAAQWFRDTGAPNFVEADMVDPKTDEHFRLTMQRGSGKTPAVVLGELRAENDRLKNALRYWLPDETMIPPGHEVAWNEHVQLIPEHRTTSNQETRNGD